MIKAVFTDFYGTLAHEDGDVVARVGQKIFSTGNAENISQISDYWWEVFQRLYTSSYGESFRTQRELEHESLAETIRHFGSAADADELSELMFAQWQKPPAFADTLPFFENCPLPVYIVSNIDRRDLEAAVEYLALQPEDMFTSEDARSYKPRKELFEYALEKTGLSADEVIHVGDSLSSDVGGAGSAGIRAVWLDRGGRGAPEGVDSIKELTELFAFL